MMLELEDRYGRSVWVAPLHIIAIYQSDSTAEDGSPVSVLRTAGDLQIVAKGKAEDVARLFKHMDRSVH